MKLLLSFLCASIFIINCTTGIKYWSAIEQIGAEEYEGANALIVFDSTEISLERDGTGSATTHRLIKVFNGLGRKKYGEATFSYITLYDTVVVQGAWVIKPDKRVIKVPQNAITDMPMPAWEGSKFYIPNLRLVKITFPELEDGGAVAYKVKTITHNAPFDSTFDYWELFESTEPIKKKVLRISLPPAMPLRYKTVNGDVEHSDTTIKDRVIHTWQKSNIPRVVSEPAMPPLENVLTKLLITCTNSWQDYSRWYYKICEPKLAPDSEIINKVRELVVPAKSHNDTIRALYEFVCKEIRYVETELIGKKGGYEPASAGFTFKNKYGVCRDKAALLVSLLRTAGIKESYMVLTNPMLLKMDPALPVSSEFNHAIVAIRTDTGYLYLDPTAENSVRYLVPYEEDKPVLVCTRDGEDIARTPVAPIDSNLSQVISESELDEAGTLKGKTVIIATGATDYQLRNILQMFPRERIEELFLSSIKAEHPRAKMDSIKYSDPRNFSQPIELSLFFTIPDYVLKINKEWHLSSGSMSSLGSQSGLWNISERNFPIYLWARAGSSSRSILKFPRGLKIKSLPEDKSYEDNLISFHTKHRVDKKEKNIIISETLFAFKEALIEKEDYAGFRENMKKIEETKLQEIILEER